MNDNSRGNQKPMDNHRERFASDKSGDIADARKQRVQGFKLNIDESVLGGGVQEDTAFIPPSAENTADALPQENLWAHKEEEAVSPKITEDITSYSGEEQKQKMDKEERLALKSYKKSEKKRMKVKSEKNGCMFRMIWLAMIMIIAVVLGQFLWNGISDLLGASRPPSEQTVVIDLPENSTFDQVVDILLENDLIKEEGFFRLYAKLTKSEKGFISGIHSMDANMDYEAILNTLQSGRQLTDFVTIQFKEGMTIREYAEKLEEKQVCKATKFLELCNSDEFDDEFEFIKELKPNDKRVYKVEGYLFPDTYDFFIGEDPSDTIRRFLSNFKRKYYTDKNRYPGYTDPMTLEEYANKMDKSVSEVINMAALVQAEAANDEDMYVVSSIFYNRLATDSSGGVNIYGDGELNKLKSDATLYYPYKSLESIPKEIEKTFKSNYNTYRITGLPPGAICNPGLTAIAAAIDPDSTDYYYFCHKAATEDSPAKAYYAVTYDQHLINMAEAGLS